MRLLRHVYTPIEVRLLVPFRPNSLQPIWRCIGGQPDTVIDVLVNLEHLPEGCQRYGQLTNVFFELRLAWFNSDKGRSLDE